jgi:hypothetical protein
MKKYFILLFLSIGLTLSSQTSSNISIEFDLNSTILTKQSKELLNQTSDFFLKKIKDEKCILVMSTKTCKKELILNKDIGLMRCREVIDYLEANFKISRSNFFIIDEHFDGLEDDKCSNVRNVNFRFICE